MNSVKRSCNYVSRFLPILIMSLKEVIFKYTLRKRGSSQMKLLNFLTSQMSKQLWLDENRKYSCLAKTGISDLYTKLLVFLANIKQDHVSDRENFRFVCFDAEDGCVPLVVFAL